jgi:hypothetical protein
MEFNMKKLVFFSLAALLVLAIVSCDAFVTQRPDTDEEIVIDGVNYTDAVWSADGRALTLYLEGGERVTAEQRALTRDLALMGHDYYEVVFVGNNGGTNVIARASWEIGNPVGITGVYRPAPDIDYSLAALPTNDGDASAILFVGKRADKTLLAVGGIISTVDGVTGATATDAVITPTTRSVTFQVIAFEAGADVDATASSFLTSTDNIFTNVSIANTTVNARGIDGVNFPLFEIDSDDEIAATYTITGPGNAALTNYLPGIIVNGTGNTLKRAPRYPVGGGLYHEVKAAFIDTNTSISLVQDVGQNAVSEIFNPIIRFNIDSTDSVKGVFSFLFNIPVVALTNTAAADGTFAIIWTIRPGYLSNLYDLDDGSGGAGGCILIGVDYNDLDPIEIFVTGP